MSTQRTWLVSACLLGVPCRHDGRPAREEARNRLGLLEDEAVVACCPEVDGGLPIPRPAADLSGGDGVAVLDGVARVKTREGFDVTKAFVAGAERAVALAKEHGATHACLKSRSPSCGAGQVHTDRGLAPGDGVTAAALRRQGLVVVSDEELEYFFAGEAAR